MTHASRHAAILALGAFATAPALAHHPMGGDMPTTLMTGLLSGLGHPLIEPAHLLFLLGAAVLAGVSRVPLRQCLLLLALFVLGSTWGTLLDITPVPQAALQVALAASILALVPGLWRQRGPGTRAGWTVAVAAGVVHGLAYSEAVIGAETTPVLAYLAGLAVIQSVLLTAVCLAVRHLTVPSSGPSVFAARGMAGVMLAAGLGVALIGA